MNRAALIALIVAGTAGWVMGQPKPEEAVPAPMQPEVRPTVRTPNCTVSGCHAKELDHKFQHGPTAVSACDSCHVYADPAAHTFKNRAEGRELCTFCHINKAGSEAPVSHKPFADGECLKCHNPHGGEVRFNLRKPDTNQLCLSCHEKVLAGHTSVHKAVTEKNCTACHKPHSSEHQKLLTKDVRSLCISCHEDVQHQVETATSFHDPLKPGKGDCLQCHTPHASDTTHQLKAPPAQLCGECHKDVAQTASTASNPHSAVLNGEACLNCHKPHGSSHSKLMKDEPVATCLACHKEAPKSAAAQQKAEHPSRPVFADPEPTAANQATPSKPTKPAQPVPELADKTLNPHGPVAEGKCAACHDVHGGSRPNLLKASFSNDFYTPFAAENFALCFTCHDQQLAATQKTTEASPITNFRDGERNLHFLHVNKGQGRTCMACHTVHASKVKEQICETTTYGNWQLPINFKITPTGGSCAPGCHRQQSYTREAVKIPVRQPEPLRPALQGPTPPAPAANGKADGAAEVKP